MENEIKTEAAKFFTVTWAQRAGKFYTRHEQTVRGEAMLSVVLAAAKSLPGVPVKSVRYQGAL